MLQTEEGFPATIKERELKQEKSLYRIRGSIQLIQILFLSAPCHDVLKRSIHSQIWSLTLMSVNTTTSKQQVLQVKVLTTSKQQVLQVKVFTTV